MGFWGWTLLIVLALVVCGTELGRAIVLDTIIWLMEKAGYRFEYPSLLDIDLMVPPLGAHHYRPTPEMGTHTREFEERQEIRDIVLRAHRLLHERYMRALNEGVPHEKIAQQRREASVAILAELIRRYGIERIRPHIQSFEK